MRFALQRGPGRNPWRHRIGEASPARKGGNLRYQANPVCVTANVITEVGELRGDHSHLVTLDDGREVVASEQMILHMGRLVPVPGDYWVLNEEDGTLSIYPKRYFEHKYRPIE